MTGPHSKGAHESEPENEIAADMQRSEIKTRSIYNCDGSSQDVLEINMESTGDEKPQPSASVDIESLKTTEYNEILSDDDFELGYNEDVYDMTTDAKREVTLERIQTIRSLNDDIPDTFTGWGLLSTIGTAIMNLNTWGCNSAYALYLQEYLNNDIFPGATKIDFGTVGALSFSSGLTFAPFINRIVGIIGIKPTIVIGAFVQCAGAILASFSTKLWQIMLTQGVLQGVGMALVAVPSIVIVPQWFKGGPGGKRNWAMGFVAAGTGVGGIVYNIGMEPIMKKYSWRWSLRTQGVMCLVLTLISTLMIRSRNKEIKPIYKVYDKAVWHNFGVIMMLFWVTFTDFGYVTLMYNLGDFTRSMGYTGTEASVVSTMIAVGIIYGRPAVGKLADYIGPVQSTILVSWLVALLSFAMWIPCKNYPTAIVFAMFEGSMMGTIWLTMATINGAVIGLRKFGIGMAVSWVAVGISGFISPIVGIALKDDNAVGRLQYRNVAIFVGCSYFGAGVMLCILRGWLIARDRLFARTKQEDRLEISVPPSMALHCMLEMDAKI